jgi:molybdenum cofactor cytidylyltransferase
MGFPGLMRLKHAFGLQGGEAIAFVGAGGKTSAMFALAGEVTPPVLLSTTTHLGAWQANLADKHHVITSAKELQKIDFNNEKTVLLTGPVSINQRLSSMDPMVLEGIYKDCRTHGYSLLIEADGARQRPLKAPADYEPVIPPWVDQVVVMAGLGGLGKPLDVDSVHRPELFAQLAGLKLGEEILVTHLAQVLGSPLGGLKGIPEGASRILFLNQAEGDMRRAQGARLARILEDAYERVLIGSFQQQYGEGPVSSAHGRTAGIILAAGGSERLGRVKQLLDWCGVPFVRQVAQTVLSAGLDPLIVVTGSDRVAVESALSDLAVKCVHNPDWVTGQSSSMRVGLDSLPHRCDRVMFLLSDQPQVSPLLIRQLIERHNQQRAPITAPMMRARRGNPVLFGKETFEVLHRITGDEGGRAAFKKFKVDSLPWLDDRALLDVDQVSDYDKLIGAYFDFI